MRCKPSGASAAGLVLADRLLFGKGVGSLGLLGLLAWSVLPGGARKPLGLGRCELLSNRRNRPQEE